MQDNKRYMQALERIQTLKPTERESFMNKLIDLLAYDDDYYCTLPQGRVYNLNAYCLWQLFTIPAETLEKALNELRNKL